MSEPLYKIAADYAEAAALLAETDLDEQTIADTLEGLAGDLRDKAIAVASVIRNMEADAKAIREAICDMESRLTRIETRTVGLREYLLTTLQATNIRNVECPWFAVSVKKNSPRVVIDDESLLPTEMMTIKPPPPPTPNKRAIADALKAGYLRNAAHFERSERLEIK